MRWQFVTLKNYLRRIREAGAYLCEGAAEVVVRGAPLGTTARRTGAVDGASLPEESSSLLSSDSELEVASELELDASADVDESSSEDSIDDD
jgi:hypothetical protein